MSQSTLFPTQHAPFSCDDENFSEWKRKQAAQISNRGSDHANPENEERYNDHMTRRCLDAYMCYKELDVFGQCLIKHRLLDEEKAGSAMLPSTSTPAIDRVCKIPFVHYSQCIASRDNQETVVKTGILNPNCRRTNESLVKCMQVHISEEEEEQTRGIMNGGSSSQGRSAEMDQHFNARIENACRGIYVKLARCGLNHLWEEYWRAITNYGDQEDFKAYQLETSVGAKTEYSKTISEVEREIKKSGATLGSVVIAATSTSQHQHRPSEQESSAVKQPQQSGGGGWGWFGWGRRAEGKVAPTTTGGNIPEYNDVATQRALGRIYGSSEDVDNARPPR